MYRACDYISLMLTIECIVVGLGVRVRFRCSVLLVSVVVLHYIVIEWDPSAQIHFI